MKKKYNYSNDFNKLNNLLPPIKRDIKPIIRMVDNIMKHFKYLPTDKNCVIKQIKIKSFDDYKMNLVVIIPKTLKEPSSCVFDLHGGGFMFGLAPYQVKLVKEYCLKTNSIGIIPHYRTSVIGKYPIPFKDCVEAYKYIIDNSFSLNIDTSKVFAIGDSAGGSLVASLSHYIRDNKLNPIKGLLMLYPVTDRRSISNSIKKYQDTPVWNGELNLKMWDYYISNIEADNIAYISPNEASNFNDLSPTYIELCEYDCLHDEGLEYYQKLRDHNLMLYLTKLWVQFMVMIWF